MGVGDIGSDDASLIKRLQQPDLAGARKAYQRPELAMISVTGSFLQIFMGFGRAPWIKNHCIDHCVDHFHP